MRNVWKVGALMVILLVSSAIASEREFIFGVDVSMLHEIEKSGGIFYDGDAARDCLEILKSRGVNWIRLRIWNDPTDENGTPLGGGNCSHVNMVEIAKRAKNLGMKVLIDFHYSDWWADPGKQNKPKAWRNLHGEELKEAVYKYTKFVLDYMKSEGVHVDMVQVGNELNNGFLWPDGQISGPGAGGFDEFAELLKSAVKAVRDFEPNIRVVVHLADGGNNSLYRWFFDELLKRNVDFDIIGVSFYPYWHGTLLELAFNLNDIAARYDKDVLIVETAYAWTLEEADGHPNIFGDEKLQWLAGYKATVKGQKSFLRDLVKVLKQVPNNRGLGFFYWEGAWIPVRGVGWKTGEGNPWENQALFDFHGRALESLNVFEEHEEKVEIAELFPILIETIVGQKIDLPEKIKALFSDDSVRLVPVTWQVELEKLKEAGEYVIAGKIVDYDKVVQAKLIVREPYNYMVNASFETGSFDPWIVEGDRQAVKVVRANPPQNAHHGVYAVNYWLDKPFEFEMYQTVYGLAEGTYKLSMWIQGSGGDDVELSVSEHGGEFKSLKVTNRGWLQWNHPTMEFYVTTGKVKVKLRVKGKAGNWGWLDEFQLIRIK